MRKLLLTCTVICNTLLAVGQDSFEDPKKMIGYPMPEYVFEKARRSLDETSQDYRMRSMSLKELQGKWSILYFWTRNCTPCIWTFPKWDHFKKTYGKDLNIVLIGFNDQWNHEIKGFFAGVSLVQKINVPITFDTVLMKRMKINSSGTAIIVDPKGILRHVILGSDLKEKDLKRIIARKE